ncbi:MAG: 50S ribosomal protein L6 [Planctomycetota bacterium]
MSRIGKKPIVIPAGVQATVNGSDVSVKGPKGSLSQTVSGTIKVSVDDGGKKIIVERQGDERPERALHGLYRALINNMVKGVTAGYSKTLKVVGTGYRVQLQGNKLVLSVGLNSKRPEEVVAPAGIKFDCPDQTTIVISGIDKQLVGETAANVRGIRPPEPYKGKGIRYNDEYVRILPGKTIAAGK